MGGTKRLIEEHEAKESEARRIAISAKVLRVCEVHDEIYAPSNFDDDIKPAYMLGASRLKKGSLQQEYESQRELTDLIKSVVDDAAEECWMCAKVRDA